MNPFNPRNVIAGIVFWTIFAVVLLATVAYIFLLCGPLIGSTVLLGLVVIAWLGMNIK